MCGPVVPYHHLGVRSQDLLHLSQLVYLCLPTSCQWSPVRVSKPSAVVIPIVGITAQIVKLGSMVSRDSHGTYGDEMSDKCGAL